MHIALNGWFWDQPHTGSGQYIRQLVTHLAKLNSDHEFHLILPPHNPKPDNVPEGVNYGSFQSGAGSASRFNKVWFEQRIFPGAVKSVEADLVHVPYWGPPLGSSVPIVVTVLDVIPLMNPLYAAGFFNRLYLSLVRAALFQADAVITISETAGIDIERELQIPRHAIEVTYLAPDPRFHPRIGAENDEVVRQKYKLPDRFVLYLGGFDARKQVNELLLAYTYVREAEGENVALVLAGKTPDWSKPLFPDLPTYAERLNLSDIIHWPGYIDEADKAALLRLADVFVFPSENEGFGLPPLEAMACGTPVVAWDSVVADEVLEGGAYIVSNAREMAGAIIGLLEQKPLRDTMINQGIAQATKYSWRKTAQQTLAVYERIMGQ